MSITWQYEGWHKKKKNWKHKKLNNDLKNGEEWEMGKEEFEYGKVVVTICCP